MSTYLLRPAEAAAILGVSKGTLANWRSAGTSPIPYVKLPGGVRYRLSDIEAYIASHTVEGAA